MPGACTKELNLKNRHTGDWPHPPRRLSDVKPAIDLLMDDDTLQDCVHALVIRQYPGERDEAVVENDVWYGSVVLDIHQPAEIDGRNPLAGLKP
mgnify:CR=1 FL=1